MISQFPEALLNRIERTGAGGMLVLEEDRFPGGPQRQRPRGALTTN